MCNLPVPPSDPGADQPVRLGGFALRPLLKFHNDSLVAVRGVPTANHEIKTTGGTGQLVLHDDNHGHPASRIRPPGPSRATSFPTRLLPILLRGSRNIGKTHPKAFSQSDCALCLR